MMAAFIERLSELPSERLGPLVAESEAAARLYERMGSRPCVDVADCTHLMELR